MKLDNLANNFERGKIDTFVINSLALGTNNAITKKTKQTTTKQQQQKQNKKQKNKKKKKKSLMAHIGTIERIEIGHDGSRIGSAWFLSYVIIDCPDTATKYYFYSDQWYVSPLLKCSYNI
jgi:hypothetical protein